jgi:ELWxxDGT repeat protein
VLQKLLLTLLAFLMACTVQATPAPLSVHLVVDTNTQPGSYVSRPTEFTGAGGAVYFVAENPETGRELFVIDDPDASAHLVLDVAPGPASSQPANLRQAGNFLAFTADDGIHGRQLRAYALDTHVATRLTDLQRDSQFDVVTPVASLPTGLVFASQFSQLWITDGSVQGTHAFQWPELYRFLPGTAQALDGSVVLAIQENVSHKRYLLRLDLGGTTVLATDPDTDESPDYQSIVCSGTYFAFVNRTSGPVTLWHSNGSSSGTVMAGQSTYPDIAPGQLACQGNLVFFVPEDGFYPGPWLWSTDGTSAGTHARIKFGNHGGSIQSLRQFGSHLIFFAPYDDGDPLFDQQSLWLSDGTSTGTHVVYPSPAVGNELLPLGNRMAFVGYDSGYQALWAVEENATSAASLNLPNFLLASYYLRSVGGKVYYDGGEPWVVQGTPAVTHPIAVWNGTGDGMEVPYEDVDVSAVSGDVLFFSANSSLAYPKYSLWRTDGSSANTWQIATDSYLNGHINVAPVHGGVALAVAPQDGGASSLYGVTQTGTQAHLISSTVGDKVQSWTRSSGSNALVQCGDYTRGLQFCSLSDVNGSVAQTGKPADFFLVSQRIGDINGAAVVVTEGFGGSTQQSLWRTDGTAPGTFLLGDVKLRFDLLNHINTSATLGNEIFFQACPPSGTCGLYATSAAAGSLRRVEDTGTQIIYSIATAGPRIVYQSDSAAGIEVWSSSGTTGGAVRLANFEGSTRISDLLSVGGHVHFVVSPSSYWVTDGTVAGTNDVVDPLPFPPATSMSVAAVDSSRTVYVCTSATTGDELCVSDGTSAGTRLLADIFPGPRSASISFLNRTSRGLFFIADDGRHGKEPWMVELMPETIFASGFDP